MKFSIKLPIRTLISGSYLFLFFMLSIYLQKDGENRNLDALNSPRVSLIFIHGFFLPGVLFATAVVWSLKGSSAGRKMIFVVAQSVLYTALIFWLIQYEHTKVFIPGAAVAAVISTFLFHSLLRPLRPVITSLLVALLVGGIAAIPFAFLMATSPEQPIQTHSVLPFLSVLLWQAGIGWVFSRFSDRPD